MQVLSNITTKKHQWFLDRLFSLLILFEHVRVSVIDDELA